MARIALVHGDDPGCRTPLTSLFLRSPDDLRSSLASYGHDVRSVALRVPAEGSEVPATTRRTLRDALAGCGFDVVHGIGRGAGRILADCLDDQPWAWSAEYDDPGHEAPPPAALVIAPTDEAARRLRRGARPRTAVRTVPERLSREVVDEPPTAVAEHATRAVTILDGDRDAVSDAVRALRLVRSMRLTIVADPADGRDVRRIELLARGLQVDDRVHWYLDGGPDGVRRALADAQVYLALSRRRIEPAPVVAAMALGTPVMVSAAPGGDELVLSGTSGLVVPVASPRRLAVALHVMLEEPRLRLESALAARAQVRDRLHPARTAEDLLRAYSDVFPGVADPGNAWDEGRAARRRRDRDRERRGMAASA